tara:strand:- start:1905 stop:2189 length:285 start_codon:yes stop_codon:yes gene_type:complete
MSGSQIEKTKEVEKEVSGFLIFNKAMIKNLNFQEDSSDKYNSKLKISMEIDVPYGVDVKRVGEDLTTLISMVGCEGKVNLKNDGKDKDEGDPSV